MKNHVIKKNEMKELGVLIGHYAYGKLFMNAEATIHSY